MELHSFFDLNVLVQNANIDDICEQWLQNKYRTIALNQLLDLTEIIEIKKKKGERNEIKIPEPYSISLTSGLLEKLKVFNRLTIKIPDATWFPRIFQGKSQLLKSFDIIAVMPLEQTCLQQAITTPDVDIICMDHESKPQWKLSRKLYNIGVEQNKYFEIIYSPLIIDSTARKNIIQLSHQYFTVAKSRNVIVSSGAFKMELLRTPYEVLHLCFLFGLKEGEARNTIEQNPRSLLNRTMRRRQNRTLFSISKT